VGLECAAVGGQALAGVREVPVGDEPDTGVPVRDQVLDGSHGPVVVVGQRERRIEPVDPPARDHDRLAGVAQALQVAAPDGDRDRDGAVDLGPGSRRREVGPRNKIVGVGAGAERLDDHHPTADGGQLAGEAGQKLPEEAPPRALGEGQDRRRGIHALRLPP
jgi:hypothetical protein